MPISADTGSLVCTALEPKGQVDKLFYIAIALPSQNTALALTSPEKTQDPPQPLPPAALP